MRSVFVHGVPEDAHLWDALREHLSDRSTAAVNLPGFGEPVPAGFDASKEAYVAWLVTELERFEGPVDLVGHDWGGGLVGRVVFTRPDLVRTWAIDTVQFFNPRSVWHDLARKWQTPAVGEQVMAYQDGMDEEKRVAALVAAGMTEDYARHVAPLDPVRNQCILSLYRSAIDVFKEWAAAGPSPLPGLYLAGAHDQYASHELGTQTAQALGMKAVVFEDLGHWWALHDPARGAAALRAFWDAYVPAQTSKT